MWTVRLPDAAVSVDSTGAVVGVDARGVPVVDARPEGEVPATVDVRMTWKGNGRHRRVRTSVPAFEGQLFRRVVARGTFAAAEDGFSFASSATKPVRATFAELGTERNGVFLGAATACTRCAVGW